jgi:hypothetical protein
MACFYQQSGPFPASYSGTMKKRIAGGNIGEETEAGPWKNKELASLSLRCFHVP